MRLHRILWALAAVLLLPALAGAAVITYEREELPGGGVLLVKESRQLPMVRITVSIPSGSRHESPEQAGLANLTSALLTRGTNTKSASDIEKMNDALGGGVGVEAGRARAEVSMRVLTRDLDEGLSLLSDVLRNPTFPAEEMEKTKRRIVGGLRRQRERPGHLANKALRKSLFGETPYGRMVEGTEASIKKLRREDLVRFHRKWYGMKGAIFVFVGDVSLKARARTRSGPHQGLASGRGENPRGDAARYAQEDAGGEDRPSSHTDHGDDGQPLAQAHEPRFLRRARDELHPGRGRVFQQDHGKPERRKKASSTASTAISPRAVTRATGGSSCRRRTRARTRPSKKRSRR